MNIGILTHEPFHPPSGGGSSQALYLVEEMVRRGHSVHVFAPQAERVQELEAQFKIRIHPFTTWRMGRYAKFRNFKYLAYPTFLAKLVRSVAKDVKFDVLLAQHAISCVTAGQVRRELDCAVAMNFLDYLTGYFDSWPKYMAPPAVVSRLKQFELSLPLKHKAEAIFTISDELADLFKKEGYPAERIVPIYYGYDGKLFQPTFQPSPSPLVVMHGSLDHHHINEFGAQALAKVYQKRPDTRFRFVGHRTDALVKVLNTVKNIIPESAIECTGFVPYAEVAKRIQDATVGIVPYAASTGAHCTVVAKTVEYAAMGVPMVCTALRGTVRYWGTNPIIRFSTMEPDNFAERVLSWFDEPAVARLTWAKAASAKVRAELDWDPFSRRVVDRLEAIHRERTGKQ
jgi:glycosyltransferase involved in cell wall biosynthesis